MPYTGAGRTDDGRLNTNDIDLLDTLVIGLASTARSLHDAVGHATIFAVYER